MSYDIRFKAKIENIDYYVDLDAVEANITWNAGKIIRLSTGLEWKNEANNGFCTDVMPAVYRGLRELEDHPEKYKSYEASIDWGTVHGAKSFFRKLILDWECFCQDYPQLVPAATFWIE